MHNFVCQNPAIFNIDGPIFFSFSGCSIVFYPLIKLDNKVKLKTATTKKGKKIFRARKTKHKNVVSEMKIPRGSTTTKVLTCFKNSKPQEIYRPN